MTLTAADSRFLAAAVKLAERGLFTTTPNPRVGALLVRNGKVLARGWHERAGGLHAEAAALAAASGSVAGATCYASLEPCAHYGRTPPCADALIEAGVARVVVAMRDPHPLVAGEGLARLRRAGIHVEVGECAAARELNVGFFSRIERGRPWVRLKVASSLDGRSALASGESKWITGAPAREDVQYWRARSCAVLTGIGTVLADDPRLTVRSEAYRIGGAIRQPLRVVLDATLRTPLDAAVLALPNEVLLVCADAAPTSARSREYEQRGVELWRAGPRIELEAVLRHLAERGINELLVEAGPTLTGAFLEAGLWDEAIFYVAPKLLGDAARPVAKLHIDSLAAALTGKVIESRAVGEDIRLRVLREESREKDPSAH